MTDAVVEFISRECKIGQHEKCHGKWQGLGFEINCDCEHCHKKSCWTLEQVEEPFSNTNHTIQPLSMQGVASTK